MIVVWLVDQLVLSSRNSVPKPATTAFAVAVLLVELALRRPNLDLCGELAA